MGIWGINLYQNDTSLDVKEEFEHQLRDGKGVEEITQELVDNYSCLMGSPCEEPLFWFSLADTQWNLGVLLPYVRDRALFWIQEIRSTKQFQTQNQQGELQKEKVLFDLQIKLLSPQPPTQKPVKRKVYKCEWNIDDVFAYQMNSDLSKERGLWGRYFLIQKVDDRTWGSGHIVPIVYVKITKENRIPTSIVEYNELEYVQTWFTRYEERFFPIDGRRPEEDIAEKSKICYEVDEFGFLPQFRIALLNTSKKSIPSNLRYLGKFENAVRPPKEFIPHSKTNIPTVAWRNFGETFEVKMIHRYCEHNLRELSIYHAR